MYSLLNSNVKLLLLWLEEGKEERKPSESTRWPVSISRVPVWNDPRNRSHDIDEAEDDAEEEEEGIEVDEEEEAMKIGEDMACRERCWSLERGLDCLP